MEKQPKELHVLSWGGGTQSTALMLMVLEEKIKDTNGKIIKPDYIVFADTKNEASFLYNQLYKVIDYVKKNYGFDIIITSKNKEQKTDQEIIKMINGGLKYRSSQYADLFQEHKLYFQGYLKSFNSMPFWVVDKFGTVGKTPVKACTVAYKIDQIMKEIKLRENVKSFAYGRYQIYTYIGFTFDEISRVKSSFHNYVENRFPLVELQITKDDCINFVEQRLGFKPQSSVCNMCYANAFERVYKIFKEDKNGYKNLIELDTLMGNKGNKTKLDQDVYMFRWQAKIGKRLRDIDMEEIYNERNKYKQLSMFDVIEEEEKMSCLGGCFI